MQENVTMEKALGLMSNKLVYKVTLCRTILYHHLISVNRELLLIKCHVA